jgi:uncharacterized membrane protein YfcA
LVEHSVLAYVFVGAVAAAVSMLTLFAGFGLGTLLMPAFALFFPVEVAVAATAVVHALNGLFKVSLLWRHVVPRVLVRFGLTAVGCAFLGALLLTKLAQSDPVAVWQLGPLSGEVTVVKVVMGGLILVFAMLDLSPRLELPAFDSRWMPVGGAASGFLGGLSGHQGALRAAFLLPLGLAPAQFAGTQAVLASMVDFARLSIYGTSFLLAGSGGLSGSGDWALVIVATLCAFAGAFLGTRMLPRVTIGGVRRLTGALLLIVGLGLATGIF